VVPLDADDVLFDNETISSALNPKQALGTVSFWKQGVIVVHDVLTAAQGSQVDGYLEKSSELNGLWNGNQSATPDDSARRISSVDVSRLQETTGVDIFGCIKYAQ
jgi:hypothetical protein